MLDFNEQTEDFRNKILCLSIQIYPGLQQVYEEMIPVSLPTSP